METNRRNKALIRTALAATAMAVIAGCASSASPQSGTAASTLAPQHLAACNAAQVGPNEQAPTSASSVTLSAAEIAKFKALHRTIRVATFWQVPSANGTLMLNGLKAAWAQYGLSVKIISTSYSAFDASTQSNNIESQIVQKPDAMIGILDDPSSEQAAIAKVNAAKIPIIFWDLPAGGSTQYTSIVTSDGQQAGCLAADALAAAIHDKGDIAVLPMAYAFYPTDQRVAGFLARIKSYPGIKVVATGYGVGATTEANGVTQGEALLQRYPDLAGFFVSWLDPAMGVVSAARSLGRSNIAITSVDLAEENALLIAGCSSTLKASSTQLPYAEGLAEGKLLVKIMDGETVPRYVVTPTPIATHSTVLSVYQQVYQSAAPTALKNAVAGHCG